MNDVTEEYLRRNLMVAKAFGAAAGVQSVIDRLQSRTSKPPRWALNQLADILHKCKDVAQEMASHRDELA